MRALIQRVLKASVTVNDSVKSAIGRGLLIFVGIEDADDDEEIKWLSNKIVNLRIFDDENEIPNISVKDIKILMVIFYWLVNLRFLQIQKKETGLPILKRANRK